MSYTFSNVNNKKMFFISLWTDSAPYISFLQSLFFSFTVCACACVVTLFAWLLNHRHKLMEDQTCEIRKLGFTFFVHRCRESVLNILYINYLSDFFLFFICLMMTYDWRRKVCVLLTRRQWPERNLEWWPTLQWKIRQRKFDQVEEESLLEYQAFLDNPSFSLV